MAQQITDSGFADLNQNDLKDQTLWKLNTEFKQIWGKLGTFFSPGSANSYPSTPTFVTVKASGQSQPPADENEFLTRASGDALYGPAVQRKALLTGAYPPAGGTQPVAVNPIQPLGPNDFGGLVLYGTHANRPNSNSLANATLYFETDRTVLYQVNNTGVSTWVYVAGTMHGNLNPSTVPTDLGPNDNGFLFYAEDYKHEYWWNGLTLTFQFFHDESGYVVASMNTNPPIGGLWQLCDGSTVGIAQANATIVNLPTPNLTQVSGNYAVLMSGGFTGGLAPSTPQWNGGAKTDDESAHIHDMAGHGHPFLVVNTETVQSGAGASVAGAQAGTTGGPSPSNTAAGSAHHHSLSNANAQLLAPGEGSGGMPYRVALNWYVRR